MRDVRRYGRSSSRASPVVTGCSSPVRRTACAWRYASGLSFWRLACSLRYAPWPVMKPAVSWSSQVAARSSRVAVSPQRPLATPLNFASSKPESMRQPSSRV